MYLGKILDEKLKVMTYEARRDCDNAYNILDDAAHRLEVHGRVLF